MRIHIIFKISYNDVERKETIMIKFLRIFIIALLILNYNITIAQINKMELYQLDSTDSYVMCNKEDTPRVFR